MAHETIHDVSYVGANDVADMTDTELWQSFKQDAGFYKPTDVFDLNEDAEGFNGWTINRVAVSVLRYTSLWNSEEDYDAFKVAVNAAGYNTDPQLADWTVESV